MTEKTALYPSVSRRGMLAGAAGLVGAATLAAGPASAQTAAREQSGGAVNSPTNPRYYPNAAWLAQRQEEIIEPGLEIIDPHHHLWDRQGHRYLLDQLLADTGSGHNITQTVFIECGSMYRAEGPVEMKPVGETEFVNGTSAMSASGQYGKTRLCAGIVGHADLRLGDGVARVLEAQVVAGDGRFRGIRHSVTWDASDALAKARTNPTKGQMLDATWRAGFARVAPLGLIFEAWLYHTQLLELADLARAYPQTTIILNHVGGPIGIGPYKDKKAETFAQWKAGIAEVGKCQNVVVKLGGLGMLMGMFEFYDQEIPPSSAELATAYAPYIDTCIAAFGADRSMFESNFPPDAASSSYAILWNAFKRLAANYSANEKAMLFSGTAKRVYRLA
ncbi:MAG: amidohydrolase family protein [Acetobacteraceae bacterium]|nr:amidohydrolase family protein [Acetobacteraceae bacterium]